MATSSFPELLDEIVSEALFEVYSVVQDVMPTNSVIETTLMSSYTRLTPQEQLQIVEMLGADWFLKLSTRIEKRLRQLTKPE